MSCACCTIRASVCSLNSEVNCCSSATSAAISLFVSCFSRKASRSSRSWINTGSRLKLTCSAVVSPSSPTSLFWYRELVLSSCLAKAWSVLGSRNVRICCCISEKVVGGLEMRGTFKILVTESTRSISAKLSLNFCRSFTDSSDNKSALGV